MTPTHTRKFSLEDDFMNFTIDDIVFGYIQHLATYAPELNTLYVPVKKVSASKADIAWIINKTTRTVSNKINKLIENGLIQERQIKLNDKDEWVYVIPQETCGKYEIIQDEMVWYILQTRTQNALKVYIYLLNKYKWKLKTKDEMYSFTASEILEAMGYSSSSNGAKTSAITTLLESLRREGIIDYVDYWDTTYCLKGTDRKRLTFVATGLNQLNRCEERAT